MTCGLRRLALLAALVPAARATAQSPSFAFVDSAMLNELGATQTPGAAVVVVAGDRVVYAKGFGQSAATGGTAVTPEMLFRVASVTKVFTAATLVTLAERHRIDLGAPIGMAIPELPDSLRGITPHQLLSHTAGLTMGPVPPAGPQGATSLASAVSRVPARAAFLRPGELFSYSNVGYLLAGRLIEAASGRPYADAVGETLLGPLGMTASTFDSATAATRPVASGVVESAPGAAPPPSTAAAETWPFAGLYSSASDLAHFAIAFMNGGRYAGRQVLSTSTITRLSAPVAPFQSGDGDYGYGVRVYRHRGVDVVEHGGRGPDSRSLLYMVPSRKVAVIVLANRGGGRPYGVVDAALDAVLPGALEPVPPKPTAVPMDAAEMARLAGRYFGGFMVDVSVDDGVLTMHQGPTALPIRKLADGRYAAGPPQGGQLLAFIPGPDGAVKYLHFNMRAFRRL